MISRRQALFDTVIDRFRGITVSAGYETNLGKQVHAWRDTRKVPFTDAELESGAINVRDHRKQTTQGGPAVLTKQHHTLSIAIEGAVREGAAAGQVRKLMADLERAIGVDRRWGALAYDTLPGDDQILVAENSLSITGFLLNFSIEFRTANFDPFNP